MSTLGPGDLYGEMAILFDRPRGTSARATKPTKLVVMDGDAFREVVSQSLGTTRDFDQIIRDRLSVGGLSSEGDGTVPRHSRARSSARRSGRSPPA